MKDFLSSDESKKSIIALCFAICFIFSLIMYGVHGDISGNLLTLNGILAGGIFGMNVVTINKN